MNDKEPETSFLKKIYDKFWRHVSGTYTDESRKEVSEINNSYNKFFGKMPDVLNLGENCDKRIELSTATFKIDYWIDQLSGNFYADCERIIDIMCSYEMEKRQRNMFEKGFTDDPIHLFFYDIKQYAVKLSRTQFDAEDIKEAKKWHSLFREIIVNGVFPPKNEDSRLQVLFDLEQTFNMAIIPKLEMANENKCALEHLKSVSSHLVKFLDIGLKYLFYVGRNSDYVPNFSIRKLRLMKDERAESGETLGITITEKKTLTAIKDTWPIELLYRVFSKTEIEKEKEHFALIGVSHGKQVDTYSEGFSVPIIPEQTIKQLIERDKKNPDFYAKHIDLRCFVNAHLLLGELGKFKELFDIAKGCAEMGGNLLTFGLLREQLVSDVQDCAQYLSAIKSVCDLIERCAWEAFRKNAAGQEKISEKWRDNYTRSGVTYFSSLASSYELCQLSLMNLAAAATKKSRNELLAKTESVINKYLKVHAKHQTYRKDTLEKLGHLSSFNSFLSPYGNSNLHNGFEGVFAISGDPKQDFKKFLQIKDCDHAVDYSAISGQFFQKYSMKSDCSSQYYTGRLLANTKDSRSKPRDYYNKALTKEPNFFKANYRLAQMDLLDGKLDEASACVKKGIASFENYANNCASIGAQVNPRPLEKMKALEKNIESKMELKGVKNK